jgi:hypothetical protein
MTSTGRCLPIPDTTDNPERSITKHSKRKCDEPRYPEAPTQLRNPHAPESPSLPNGLLLSRWRSITDPSKSRPRDRPVTGLEPARMGNAEGEFPDCWFPSFYFFLLHSPSFLLSLFWLSAFSPRQQLGQRLKNTGSKSIGERNSGVCSVHHKEQIVLVYVNKGEVILFTSFVIQGHWRWWQH